MCGITAISTKKQALPFLMQGLEKLEYRGYDSAGVTVLDQGKLVTIKTKGRLNDLKEELKNYNLSTVFIPKILVPFSKTVLIQSINNNLEFLIFSSASFKMFVSS